MRTNLKTKNIELTPAIEMTAEKKLVLPIKKLIAKLDAKMDIILDIELGRTTKHHNKGKIWRSEIQLALPGLKRMLRAETVAESLQKAVNLVKNEITREIKKYKEELRTQG